MSKHCTIAFVFLSLITRLTGQNQDSLSNLNWQVQNNQVFLEWFLDQGQTCFGIEVSRRTDTLSDFETIHVIPGLCGSNDKRTRYTYTDTSAAVNSLNYYKIDLGGEAQMYTPGIFIFKDQEVLVYPQPAQGNDVVIRFKNPQNQVYSLKIYTLNGSLIKNIDLTNDFILLNKSEFEKGVYIFRLVGDEQKVVGRLMF